jgi:hypothetical protein
VHSRWASHLLPPAPPCREREPIERDMDPCNLYVGFVSPDVGQRELSDLFSSCGEVADCKLIMDR